MDAMYNIGTIVENMVLYNTVESCEEQILKVSSQENKALVAMCSDGC